MGFLLKGSLSNALDFVGGLSAQTYDSGAARYIRLLVDDGHQRLGTRRRMCVSCRGPHMSKKRRTSRARKPVSGRDMQTPSHKVMASIKAADKSYADGRVGLRGARACLVTAEHSLSTDSTFIGSISADRIREGLPLNVLDELATVLKVDPLDLADVLGMSVRTLQRRAEGGERLGPAASDRLARIRRILELAAHVFGEMEKAAHWLTSPSRALANEIPLHMLDTDVGAQRVQLELRQIEFGIPL